MDITVEDIKKKGKNLGLSYTQSLSRYLFEEILCRISSSQLKDQVWLKLEESYIHGEKKKITPNRIIYYMKEISYEKLNQAMESILEQKKNDGIQMKWRLLFLDEQLEIVLDTQVDQVELPFKIIVRPVWQQEQFPEEETYRLAFQENREITYQSYPKELNLAECFYEILDRLELIGSMEPYGTIQRILSAYPVEGRHFYFDMKELFAVRKLASMEKRWKTVLEYAGYTYMEKRWNKYRRNTSQTDISWKELLSCMDKFYTPVWEAIQKDMIFFGDWMPHLGRYLN